MHQETTPKQDVGPKSLTSKPRLKKGQKEPSDSKLAPAADGISAG